MKATSITVSHNGTDYSGEIMRVRSTMLGWEDHGILTAFLHCEGSGSGVGVGGYCLDEPPADRDSNDGRQGTAYGLDHLMRIMETVGVNAWEKLPGQTVIVLYESAGHLGQTAKGIANLLTGKALIFKEHVARFEPERAAS